MTRLARPIADVGSKPLADDPRPPKVYNRSSFEGDFLVAIPDQSPHDFELFAPESQFCEYFDGTIFMPSPVGDRHQDICLFLAMLLELHRRRVAADLHVLQGPAVLRFAPDRFAEPDVFVRVRGRDEACLVVEILSPSHRSYDLNFKAEFYQQAGIPDIWYIDHSAKTVHRDRLVDGAYARQSTQEGRIAAAMIPGFWIDVAWLWADPLPDVIECLAAILADPNGGMP